ncbi:MAG: energy transducer TonB [Rhodospirillaceae bacterium]|nr:energy transducer TonB [Rhodospirillaceae bacterium]
MSMWRHVQTRTVDAWDDGGQTMRLWSMSLVVAMGLHAVGVLGMVWTRSKPVNDMPAGAFSLELAAFGGNPQALPGGGGAKAAPAPQPEVKEAPKPKPVIHKAEVPLPKPKPKPKVKPKEVEAKPAPQANESTKAEAPPHVVQSAAVSNGSGGRAGLDGQAGAGGGLVSGRLGGGGSGLGTPLGRYKVLVFQSLWRHRKYPTLAQRMGYEGDVEVEFSLAASGEILNSRLVSGCGFGVLDREASALLRRVRKFPAFPSDLHRSTLTFRVTIPFQLT